jgi:hypothetical protein
LKDAALDTFQLMRVGNAGDLVAGQDRRSYLCTGCAR